MCKQTKTINPKPIHKVEDVKPGSTAVSHFMPDLAVVSGIYLTRLNPVLLKAFKEIAQETLDELNSGEVFNPRNPFFRQQITARRGMIKEIPATSDRLMRETIADGLSARKSPDLIIKDILTDKRLVGVNRIKTIARTETISTYNGAQKTGYLQSEIVEYLMWITARDGAVRNKLFKHTEADGEVININKGELFVNTGQTLEYPGDPGGSPANVINCRCTTIPVAGKMYVSRQMYTIHWHKQIRQTKRLELIYSKIHRQLLSGHVLKVVNNLRNEGRAAA